MLERVKTGIPGFDSLVEGGFLKNSTVLLSGGTGTGKTIFSMQFLYNGATKFNEPGVYLSFEQPIEDFKRDASVFGWDFDKLEKEKKIKLIYERPYDVGKLSETIEKAIYNIKARRLVIDSTSVWGLASKSQHDFRVDLFELSRLLEKLDITTILTSEILEDSMALSRFGVEEFLSDGVVVLYYTGIGGDQGSTMQIRKMRSTNHKRGFFPVRITKTGLKIEKGGVEMLLK